MPDVLSLPDLLGLPDLLRLPGLGLPGLAYQRPRAPPEWELSHEPAPHLQRFQQAEV